MKHTVIMCAQSALDSFAKSHAGKWPSSWAATFELLPRKEFSLGITAKGSRIEGTRDRARLLSREETDCDTPLSVLALGGFSDAPSNGDKDGAASSESSSSSLSRSCEPKIEADPFGSIEWQLAKGPRGMIHILNGDEMACHRNRLLHPQRGTGLLTALGTGRALSPRCFASLSRSAQRWWMNSDKTEL